MRPSRHRVVTVCAQSVGVVSHRVDTVGTYLDLDLDLDLRPEQIAKADLVTNGAWLRREEEPGRNVGTHQIGQVVQIEPPVCRHAPALTESEVA